MTDSVQQKDAAIVAEWQRAVAGGRGKRERLIAAAVETIYAQGVERTTLADIAAAAGIPLGNVYYYFKTKNDLVRAVVEAHLSDARRVLAQVESAHDDPRERLKALFASLADQREQISRYGCPHGSLCTELDKLPDGPGLASELIGVPVDWAERQFSELGRPDARDLAVEIIARYQGTALLSSTFRDPDLMAREAARVIAWLDTIGPGSQ
jgi:TetR/AcrR family transcriptional regulator, transcriptional repressor for nem operon